MSAPQADDAVGGAAGTAEGPESVAHEASTYLDAVRARLAHLAARERDDLLDDLRDHLAEAVVDAAAGGETLAQRLGPPEAYAEELLASAGIEPGDEPPAPPARSWWAALGDFGPVRWLGSVGRRLARRPAVAATVAYLPELRPAWWVLRGYLVVALLPLLADVDGAARSFPFPRVLGSPLLGTLLVAVAIPVSVKVGRRAAATGCWRRRLDLLHAVMAVLLLAAVAAVRPESWAAPTAYADDGNAKLSAAGGQMLWAADGRPITNIYPYDSDGNLLHNVLLYDQDGVPIANTADVDDEGSLTAQAPLDANGTPVAHAYPLERHRCAWTQNGALIPFGEPLPPPAVVVPRLAEPTATAPSTTAPSATAGGPTSTVPATATTAPAPPSPSSTTGATAGAAPAGEAPTSTASPTTSLAPSATRRSPITAPAVDRSQC